MLWVIFLLMLAAALVFVVLPVYKIERKFNFASIFGVLAIIVTSVLTYSMIGSPDAKSGRSMPDSIDDMVAALDSRLQEDPDDLAGWKMLGRSYMQLQDFPNAINAYEYAVELESSQNGETLIGLGEAVLSNDSASMAGRAGELFESGLALAPNNPQGLFYGGLSALQRGDKILAADRWEALLAMSPPAEIQSVLKTRIAEWRGLPVESSASMQPAGAVSSAEFIVDVSVAEGFIPAIDPGASVFVIARDPAQPAPPIAVVRRKAGELPDRITLSDANAMIPGRVPSAFSELEIVVRISVSGQPIASSGDWFGDGVMNTAEGGSISVLVDRQVP